jgi:hypothetical protein
MEIEAKQITLDDRIEYLAGISENQQTNETSFPWGIAIISLLTGAVIAAILMYVSVENAKKEESTKEK